MRKLTLSLFLFLLLAATSLYAANGNVILTNGAGAPVGTCGTVQQYVDSTTGNLWVCQSGTWHNSSGGGGGGGAWNTITAGANANTLTQTSAGSLVPAQTSATAPLGQISGIGSWIPVATGAIFPTPQLTLSTSTSGGTISTGVVVYVVVTYVGVSPVVPSAEVQITAGAGSTNSVTVTMPTTCTAGNLPTGVTGCTVWDSNSTLTEKQQAASAACVNITTSTCVIGTLGAGASLTWPASTGVTPPNLQAGTVNDKIVNPIYMQKGDGNWYPEAGVDISGLNALPNPKGTFTWTDRFFVNDASTAPIISNALVSIHHLSGGTTGTGTTVDDRALGVEMVNANTVAPNYDQYLGYYGETLQQNAAFTCAPIGSNGQGEDCQAGLRARTDIQIATTAASSGAVGIHGTASTDIASPNVGSCSPCIIGVAGSAAQAQVSNQTTSAIYAGVTGSANALGTSAGGASGWSFYAIAPTSRFTSGNGAFFIPAAFNNAADLAIRSDATIPSRWQGTSYEVGLLGWKGALPITNSINVTGGVTTTQMANTALSNSAIATGGTAGTSTDTYQLVYKDAAGGAVKENATHTIGTANANLTATNNIKLTFSNLSSNNQNLCTLGIASIDIYRTVNASQCNGVACTTGKIGNAPITDCTTIFGGVQSFTDTGIQGDGTTPPTVNNTGQVQGFEFSTNTNCAVNSVSPAACGSAAAGAVVIPTTTTTYTVNTSAVTAHSRITLTAMTFAGDLPSTPTCVVPVSTTVPSISNIVSGTSFTISEGSTTGQTCWQYTVMD